MATHWIVVTDTWKSRPRVASATATMVVSRIDMIDPRTTTLEVRRSSGDSVNEGAAGEVIGLLHITQRYGVVKDFPRWENRSVGVSEDAFERLRRVAFDGEHVERMAALGTRLKLSPGVIKTLVRLAKQDGVSMGEMARGIGCRPLLHHRPGRRPRRAGAGPPRARPRRPTGQDHCADRRRPQPSPTRSTACSPCRPRPSRRCRTPSCANCATSSTRSCCRQRRSSRRVAASCAPRRRRRPPDRTAGPRHPGPVASAPMAGVTPAVPGNTGWR